MTQTTGLGHETFAAMVDIYFTVGALHPLLHYSVQQTAAVVAPSGGVVGCRVELVRAGLLQEKVGSEKKFGVITHFVKQMRLECVELMLH